MPLMLRLRGASANLTISSAQTFGIRLKKSSSKDSRAALVGELNALFIWSSAATLSNISDPTTVVDVLVVTVTSYTNFLVSLVVVVVASLYAEAVFARNRIAATPHRLRYTFFLVLAWCIIAIGLITFSICYAQRLTIATPTRTSDIRIPRICIFSSFNNDWCRTEIIKRRHEQHAQKFSFLSATSPKHSKIDKPSTLNVSPQTLFINSDSSSINSIYSKRKLLSFKHKKKQIGSYDTNDIARKSDRNETTFKSNISDNILYQRLFPKAKRRVVVNKPNDERYNLIAENITLQPYLNSNISDTTNSNFGVLNQNFPNSSDKGARIINNRKNNCVGSSSDLVPITTEKAVLVTTLQVTFQNYSVAGDFSIPHQPRMPPAYGQFMETLTQGSVLLLVVCAVVVSAALGVFTCVAKRSDHVTTAPTTNPTDHVSDQRQRPIAQSYGTPMLSVVSGNTAAAAMERLRGGAPTAAPGGLQLMVGAQRDRAVRLHSVHTDLQLDLPPRIALPDGEEHPYAAAFKLRDHQQESEIYQKCIRPPPNRTIYESDSPPPYRSSSAGLLVGSSSNSSGDWSTGVVVRCHSMSSGTVKTNVNNTSHTTNPPSKSDFIQRTVKIFTGKKFTNNNNNNNSNNTNNSQCVPPHQNVGPPCVVVPTSRARPVAPPSIHQINHNNQRHKPNV